MCTRCQLALSGAVSEIASELPILCTYSVSQEPVLISAAWSSAEGGSHIARHEWKGLSKMSGQLEDWVQKQQQEEPEMNRRRRSARLAHRAFLQNMPGAFNDDEDA